LERLQDLRGILGDDGHARECLGIWPDVVAGAVLDLAVWKGPMLDPGSRRADGADVVLVLDVSPMLTAGSIGMYALRADGLEHMQLTDYEVGTDWMVPRAGLLREVLDPALWVIHRKNGAYAMRADLATVGIVEYKPGPDDPDGLRRGQLLVIDDDEDADATSQFIADFRRRPPPYRHPGQEAADRAVANVKPRPIGDGGKIVFGRRVSGVDIGPVVAFARAKYGHAQWLARQAEPLPEPDIFF
jgi:hypothetical protein